MLLTVWGPDFVVFTVVKASGLSLASKLIFPEPATDAFQLLSAPHKNHAMLDQEIITNRPHSKGAAIHVLLTLLPSCFRSSKPSSPNTSQELGPHSEPSAESVAGPPTQPLASESSAGSLPGRLALEESLSPEIGLAKAGGGATRLGGVQKTTGAAFAAKAVGEALSFEGGAETGSYFSLGINDSGKSENARAAEELTPGVDETARRAAATAGYFSLGINDSADDAGASVGGKGPGEEDFQVRGSCGFGSMRSWSLKSSGCHW